MSAHPNTEGYLSFRGYRTWYRIVGDPTAIPAGKYPLLLLHGGPGVCHDYLDSLAAMADTGRPVIFYDQLGCGYSERPDDPSMWTIELFLDELATVRTELKLDQVHILGQSWGGMLGMEYALTEPSGVVSLTIASSPASLILWVEEANRLRNELPADIQAALLRHEAAGTTDSPEYEAAMTAFYDRHVCRVVPNPDYVQNSFRKIGRQVYETMNGPSEFHVIGTLKNWDIRHRLPEIRIPSLITSGLYDEFTPMQAEIVHKGIAGSEWALFNESSHMPHAEEPDAYMRVLDDFLTRKEAQFASA